MPAYLLVNNALRKDQVVIGFDPEDACDKQGWDVLDCTIYKLVEISFRELTGETSKMFVGQVVKV